MRFELHPAGKPDPAEAREGSLRRDRVRAHCPACGRFVRFVRVRYAYGSGERRIVVRCAQCGEQEIY